MAREDLLVFPFIWLGIHQLRPREFVPYTRQVFPGHKGQTATFVFTLIYPVLPAATTVGLGHLSSTLTTQQNQALTPAMPILYLPFSQVTSAESMHPKLHWKILAINEHNENLSKHRHL